MNPRMGKSWGSQMLGVYYGLLIAWNVIAVVINVLFGLLQLFKEDAPRTFHFRLTLTDFSVWIGTESTLQEPGYHMEEHL
jgi:hypothetical protein